MTYAEFASHVGEPFEVAVADGQVLRFALAEAVQGTEPGAERLQFSLFFVGPATPVLPQGTYRLGHTGLGDLELFLVPLGPVPDGMRYQAAFA